ncbi:MAG TPA: hypothetical protein VGD00_08730, partial [Solirubrobacteraceae bacterium]
MRARSRTPYAAGLLALIVLVICGLLALAIAHSQSESRSKIVASFKLRGQSSATLVSTYVLELAEREKTTAERF